MKGVGISWLTLFAGCGFLVLLLLGRPAKADCAYQGKVYDTFDTLSITDPAYTEEIKKMGYAPDGYALVLKCMPIVDMAKVSEGAFSVSTVPAVNDAWTVSEVIYAHSEPLVQYIGN